MLWASLMAQLVKKPSAMWETGVWSLGWEDSPGERSGYPLQYHYRASQVALVVKEPACSMQEIQEMKVWVLGWEDSLEEGMANLSSILAWRMPWTEQPGGLKSIGSQRQTILKQLSTTQHMGIVILAFLSGFLRLFFSLKNIEFCFSIHVGNLGSTQFFEGLPLNLLRQV